MSLFYHTRTSYYRRITWFRMCRTDDPALGVVSRFCFVSSQSPMMCSQRQRSLFKSLSPSYHWFSCERRRVRQPQNCFHLLFLENRNVFMPYFSSIFDPMTQLILQILVWHPFVQNCNRFQVQGVTSKNELV